MLAVDGTDLCARPWAERRQILQDPYAISGDTNAWRLSTAFAGGAGLLAATAGMGLEGVVAKRVTSRYWPGGRSPYWRKVKHRTPGPPFRQRRSQPPHAPPKVMM